ncbi:MAG: SpoIIE family protein phosphatase [Prochlorococcaceae cyanobacterium]|jgi:serine phosphatase RsbU (regulator of sigma subunit)
MAVGLFEEARYRNEEVVLPPGTRLLLYSDGAYELPTREGGAGTLPEFIELVGRLEGNPAFSLDGLVAELRAEAAGGRFTDDCSLVQACFA